MLDFSFGDIYINISPYMLSIVLNILSAIGTSSDKPNEEISVIPADDLLVPKDLDMNDWFLSCAPMAKNALELLQPEKVEESNYIFNLGQVKILIKSGNVSAQPLVTLTISTVAKFFGSKNLDFEANIVADYYNQLLLAWEPLIEPVNNIPFSFRGEMILSDSCTKFNIETLHKLELLLTNSSINVLNEISNAFTRVYYTKSIGKYEKNRIFIRNYLGIDINVILSKSNIMLIDGDEQVNIKKSNRKNIILKSGKLYEFCTPDLSKIELNINLILSEACVIDRTIICTKNSVRFVFFIDFLFAKIYFNLLLLLLFQMLFYKCENLSCQ